MTAETAFNKYTEPYRQYGEKIYLKIDHSLRVRDLCLDLSGSEGLTGEDAELSAACGLLHDIGRFEQWKRYGTYNDMRSTDHGDLGAEILAQDELFHSLSGSDAGTIINAARYHNKFTVPGTLSNRDRMFVNITRDADKIDILYSFVSRKLVNQTKNSTMSDTVYQSLLSKKAIRKDDIKTKADEIAVRLAFMFDLNFDRSFEIVKENDYINRLIDVQISETSDSDLIGKLDRLRSFFSSI